MALNPFDPCVPQTRVHFTDGTVAPYPFGAFDTIADAKKRGDAELRLDTLSGARAVLYLDHVNDIVEWSQAAIDRFKQLQAPISLDEDGDIPAKPDRS